MARYPQPILKSFWFGGMMRTLSLAVLALMAGLVLQAQTLKPADLVGRWIEVGDTTGSHSDFRADSTFILTSVVLVPKDALPPGALLPTATMKITGTWRLAGDTLTMIVRNTAAHTPMGWRDMGPVPSSQPLHQLVRLEGKRLTSTLLAPDAKAQVYERQDTPKP
jgi:hypothetical protein